MYRVCGQALPLTLKLILTTNVILESHLRELPNFCPLDLAAFASNHPVDYQASQIAALAHEHEPLRVGTRDLEKSKVRINLRADAFQRHHRANYVGETRRNLEWKLVDYMRHVKHQRFEVHIAEPQAKIPVEQSFDDWFESRLVFR